MSILSSVTRVLTIKRFCHKSRKRRRDVRLCKRLQIKIHLLISRKWKKGMLYGEDLLPVWIVSVRKKIWFPLPAAQKDNYICCRWWRVWLTQMTPKSFGLSIEKWLKSLLETSGATGERWRTVQTSQCQTPWHVTTRTVLIAPHIHLYTPDHSN